MTIVATGSSNADCLSFTTVTNGSKTAVSNCVAIMFGNSSRGNAIDDSPVQSLGLQMANVEIMEISMTKNTDAKSSTVTPV